MTQFLEGTTHPPLIKGGGGGGGSNHVRIVKGLLQAASVNIYTLYIDRLKELTLLEPDIPYEQHIHLNLI